MTGMDFVKAFEWARKHPSAYGRYAAKKGETEPDKKLKEPSSAEQTAVETINQSADERN